MSTRPPDDYGLIETFRWREGVGFVRLAMHLQRLANSARTLGFRCDIESTERRIAKAALGWRDGDGDRRVRLLLARDGCATISADIVAPQPPFLRLLVTTVRLDASDPHLRHKTTRREAYEAALKQALDANCDEALLLNERGRVADASRNTLFVHRRGQLVTPSLAEGALRGVLREELLTSAAAAVGAVSIDMMEGAERLSIGNSLHGLRDVSLVTI